MGNSQLYVNYLLTEFSSVITGIEIKRLIYILSKKTTIGRHICYLSIDLCSCSFFPISMEIGKHIPVDLTCF
jgi:hypothetical protein